MEDAVGIVLVELSMGGVLVGVSSGSVLVEIGVEVELSIGPELEAIAKILRDPGVGKSEI